MKFIQDSIIFGRHLMTSFHNLMASVVHHLCQYPLINKNTFHYGPVKLFVPIPPGSPGVKGKMCVIKKGGALENEVKKGGALENEAIKVIN